MSELVITKGPKLSHLKLEPALYPFLWGLQPEEKERLAIFINENNIPFMRLNERIWFLGEDLSIVKGREKNDYSKNWRVSKSEKPGTDYKVIDTQILKEIKKKYWDLYKRKIKGYTLVLVDAERAYFYLFYEKIKDEIYQKKVNEIMHISDEIRIRMLDLLPQLELGERTVRDYLTKYKTSFEAFGSPLLMLEDEVTKKKEYYLTEMQALLLSSTLCKNIDKQVIFNTWLLQRFKQTKERERFLLPSQKGAYRYSNEREKLDKHITPIKERDIHSQLVELSTYTSIKIRNEVPIEDRRIDLLIEEVIAVELKRDKITLSIVTEVLAKKSYFTYLRMKFPTVRILFLCSPHPPTTEAQAMLDLMYPNVQYIHPVTLGDCLAQQCLSEYPENSHWWLKKILFPQFPNILSPKYWAYENVYKSINSQKEESSFNNLLSPS